MCPVVGEATVSAIQWALAALAGTATCPGDVPAVEPPAEARRDPGDLCCHFHHHWLPLLSFAVNVVFSSSVSVLVTLCHPLA